MAKRIGTLLFAGLLFAGLRPGIQAQRFFSLFTGSARTTNSDVRLVLPNALTDLTFHDASWRLASNRSAPYFGLRVGGYFRHQPHLGVEFNYTHAKAVLNTSETVFATGALNEQAVNGPLRIADTLQIQEFLNGVNIFSLHLLYRTTERPTPSFPHGRLQGYVGAGPAFFWLYNTNQVNQSFHGNSYQASGLGYSALLGVDYGLWKQVRLFMEGRVTGGRARVGTASNGTLTTPLNTWHFDLGVKYEF
jgi:opacity protein-like surface antigen